MTTSDSRIKVFPASVMKMLAGWGIRCSDQIERNGLLSRCLVFVVICYLFVGFGVLKAFRSISKAMKMINADGIIVIIIAPRFLPFSGLPVGGFGFPGVYVYSLAWRIRLAGRIWAFCASRVKIWKSQPSNIFKHLNLYFFGRQEASACREPTFYLD